MLPQTATQRSSGCSELGLHVERVFLPSSRHAASRLAASHARLSSAGSARCSQSASSARAPSFKHLLHALFSSSTSFSAPEHVGQLVGSVDKARLTLGNSGWSASRKTQGGSRCPPQSRQFPPRRSRHRRQRPRGRASQNARVDQIPGLLSRYAGRSSLELRLVEHGVFLAGAIDELATLHRGWKSGVVSRQFSRKSKVHHRVGQKPRSRTPRRSPPAWRGNFFRRALDHRQVREGGHIVASAS